MRIIRSLCIAVAVFSTFSVLAESDPSFDSNPGDAGPNFMAPFRIVDPEAGSEFRLETGAGFQFDRGSDKSMTPFIRLEIPFKETVRLWVDITAAEYWWISSRTQQDWETESRSGSNMGPTRVGMSGQLFDQDGILSLDFATQFEAWTATGKGLENRRGLDGPGYYVGAALGKDLYESEEGAVRLVRLYGNLGFIAWQTGQASQNDAPSIGAHLGINFSHGFSFDFENRNYIGWQGNDRPVVLEVKATYSGIENVDFFVSSGRSFTDAGADFETRAGVILHTDIADLPIVGKYFSTR